MKGSEHSATGEFRALRNGRRNVEEPEGFVPAFIRRGPIGLTDSRYENTSSFSTVSRFDHPRVTLLRFVDRSGRFGDRIRKTVFR